LSKAENSGEVDGKKEIAKMFVPNYFWLGHKLFSCKQHRPTIVP